MLRRIIVLVSLLALALPSAAFARDGRTVPSPERIGTGGAIDPQVLPNAIDDSRDVTVMLEMSGSPVAVVEAAAEDDELTRAERRQIARTLRDRQDAIEPSIQARGGRVLSQLQYAYNGIKVRIARSQVAALAALPNVVAVRAVERHTRGNVTSVPYIGVPSVWEDHGFTGDAVRVAIIDTGLDYTHANFGGTGTAEAYDIADESDTTIGDAGDTGQFGPDAPKVKGGWDFVGDDYDADADEGDPALTPQPDPDPLDCDGHGSHVGGTAAGFGVLADGSTFTGPYDATTHGNEFNVGPGVAPEAHLYGLRVFGCFGSTDVTVDAIEWAVAHNMDVINMSLGAPFGRRTDPSAVAATNAAAAGVIVVVSAGNSGPSPYITGSPGTATGAISTAAVDSSETFDGVILDLGGGTTVTTLAANGIVPPDGTEYTVVVLADDPATTDENEALGCSVEAFEAALAAAEIAPDGEPVLGVTVRGTCARVARAVFGQQAGFDAVVMINTAEGYPPFEGPITGNPDTGESYEVTIPFLGAQQSDGAALVAADGGTATTTGTEITNPGFQGFASFSSGGPTSGDGHLKPDVAAPGVSIASTGVGTGDRAAVISGTSMAAPHVAGVAALMREAHPAWSGEEIKAAITNSGSPAGLPGYSVTRAGAGLVTPAEATDVSVVALGDLVPADATAGLAAFHDSKLNFGFRHLRSDLSETRTITVRNLGSTEVTLTPSVVASDQSQPATISLGADSVTVAPGVEATLDVTLEVDASAIGNSEEFREVSGNIELTDGDVTLRVPYLLVPRPLSDIRSKPAKAITPRDGPIDVKVTNRRGQIAGTADFFQWGRWDRDDVDESVLGGSGYDLEAAGVQSFPIGGGDAIIAFALSTHDRWSNAAVNEYDILLDTTGDRDWDYVLIGFDLGALTAGSFDGQLASFLLDLSTGDLFPLFLAQAPTDSSTLLLFAFASDIGLSPGDATFRYRVESYSLEGAGFDVMRGRATFNPLNPAMTDFPFVEVAPGASEEVPIDFNSRRYSNQRPLGVMVVSHDDRAGQEAQTIRVRRR